VGCALCAAAFALVAAGCATWQAPADVSDAPLRERAVSDSRQDVRVSAAVLSAEDSRRMFGADVNETGVQPVWVEVRNGTSEPLWLLRPGTDPDYYSPLEVAWSLHTPLAQDANSRMDDHFDRFGLHSPILPGVTQAGILFTNPDRVTKLLNIDLFHGNGLVPFTLFLPVPGDAGRAAGAQTRFRYPDAQTADPQDLAALRSALERLPCCASDDRGPDRGDPLNAVLIGDLPEIVAALVRRSYHRDPHPVDATQQVFGRAPDVVLRKQAQAGAPAIWLRGWLAPLHFDGRAVYVVQVGRPVGGRFAPRGSASIVLHEDVDEARNVLVQDVMYSGGLDRLAFVAGVGAASPAMAGGAHYRTDGLRAALFLSTRPLSLSDVEILDWEPYLDWHETDTRPDAQE